MPTKLQPYDILMIHQDRSSRLSQFYYIDIIRRDITVKYPKERIDYAYISLSTDSTSLKYSRVEGDAGYDFLGSLGNNTILDNGATIIDLVKKLEAEIQELIVEFRSRVAINVKEEKAESEWRP